MVKTLNSIASVDISELTPELFIEKYQKTGTPVIITGLLAAIDWNLDYLCAKLGEQTFLFRNYGSSRYKQDPRNWKNIGSGVALQSMQFTQYAELLRDRTAHKNDIYLGKCSLKDTTLVQTPALQAIGARLGLTKPMTDFNLYMGPGGHASGLHYDSLDGTLMQMYGEKRVVLFPPAQTYNLYPFPVYRHLRYGLKLRSWFSRVSLRQPDLESFPRFKIALQHQHQVILRQGETLYIPMCWWHDVTALGDDMVCSVNRFWRVYPTSRVMLSWNRWRAVGGHVCALPHTTMSLAIALFGSDKKQKLSKILHRL